MSDYFGTLQFDSINLDSARIGRLFSDIMTNDYRRGSGSQYGFQSNRPPTQVPPIGSITRRDLEPLLPQCLGQSPNALDPARPGYKVTSLSLGSFDERSFDKFNVERTVDIEDGRLAFQNGSLDLSGYGFQRDCSFHLEFVPGSIQALYLSSCEARLIDVDVDVDVDLDLGDVNEINLIVTTSQTPRFFTSSPNPRNPSQRTKVRTSALDEEHHRIVPYLSRHFLITLSFSSFGFSLNSRSPTFTNFKSDLTGVVHLPTPHTLPRFITREERRYAPEILNELSSAMAELDSPALAFALEWIAFDGTLSPAEITSLIEDHVSAWEVTADYDRSDVENILFELRNRLVSKQQRRVDQTRRGQQIDESCRFLGLEKEAELARQKVIDERVRVDMFGRAKKPDAKGKLTSKGMSIEERSKRNLYWARSIVVTPSGTIRVQGRLVDKTNAVIRSNFDGVDNFLRIAFKEEDGLRLPSGSRSQQYARDELLDGTISRILKNGLMLGGRRYTFLSYSQSSLRDAAAIFVTPFETFTTVKGRRRDVVVDAAKIRASMGDFAKVSYQPAMLGARWSQSFTSSSASKAIDKDDIHRISDISVLDAAGNEVSCHTDGAGLISPALREQICKSLVKNGYRLNISAPYPSVFQFRLGGYKGILVVDEDQRGGGVGMAVRPSQEKFLGSAESDPANTDERSVFVLNIAEAFDRPRSLRLNRPLISALEDLGIKPQTFLKYQRDAVEAISFSPDDEQVFSKTSAQLRRASLGNTSGFQQLFQSFEEMKGVPPDLVLNEPFLRTALDVVRTRVLRDLKYRASIPVPNCYLLVGVPDESRKLKADQIFVALRNPQDPSTVEYLKGKVAITRSPTIGAGDVRLVEAIGPPKQGWRMAGVENCVVLPTVGSRSIASMMGGGDLDGDTYQVICLADLIPERADEPASHTSEKPHTLPRPATVDDVADCFVSYLKHDLVGVIATKHLLVSDKSELHGRDPVAMKLADLHSHAVDAPKTGRIVEWSRLPQSEHFKGEEPDFFRGEDTSSNKEYYESTRALGQLYRAIDTERFFPSLTVCDNSIDSSSSSFSTLRRIVEDRLASVLRLSTPQLVEEANARISTSTRLRDTFATNLRDLVSVHTYPRTGGNRISETELFAVANLAAGDRESRNQMAAMSIQLESLLDWMRQEMGEEEEGVKGSYAAWIVGLDEEDVESRKKFEDSVYGIKSFRWICLSILLEKIKALEEQTSQGPSPLDPSSLLDITSTPPASPRIEPLVLKK